MRREGIMDIEELIMALLYGACIRRMNMAYLVRAMPSTTLGAVTDYMFWYRERFEVEYR
jgi:hypothetical protein